MDGFSLFLTVIVFVFGGTITAGYIAHEMNRAEQFWNSQETEECAHMLMHTHKKNYTMSFSMATALRVMWYAMPVGWQIN